MSLKSIGKISKYSKALSLLDSSTDSKSLYHMIDAINLLGNVKDATALLKYTGATKEFAEAALSSSKIAGDIKDMGSILGDITNNSGNGAMALAGLGDVFKKLGATLKPALPLLATAGAIFAGIKTFQWLDDKYTLTFGTASKKLEESSAPITKHFRKSPHLIRNFPVFKAGFQNYSPNRISPFLSKQSLGPYSVRKKV